MARGILEVDFQGWILDLAHDRTAVDRARRLREQARRAGALIVCSRYLAQDGPRADPTDPGTRFIDGLGPLGGDLVLSKWAKDPFDNPDLIDNLRLRGIDSLTVCGLLTDHGVRAAVESALRLGIAVDVAADACAGSSLDGHNEALRGMAARGVSVSSAQSD